MFEARLAQGIMLKKVLLADGQISCCSTGGLSRPRLRSCKPLSLQNRISLAPGGSLLQELLPLPPSPPVHLAPLNSRFGPCVPLQVLEATKELIQEANFEVSIAGINLQVGAAHVRAGRKSNKSFDLGRFGISRRAAWLCPGRCYGSGCILHVVSRPLASLSYCCWPGMARGAPQLVRCRRPAPFVGRPAGHGQLARQPGGAEPAVGRL